MSEELNSLFFVLEKALENQVDLSRSKQVYYDKVVERDRLEQYMSSEVDLLPGEKKVCKNFDSETLENIICEVSCSEDNFQEFLLQIELLENDLELIRKTYPSVEDGDDDRVDAFDPHDSALMILSKQNGPVLRTLIAKLLTSWHDSELARQTLADSKARDDCALSDLRNELVLKNERIAALSEMLLASSQDRYRGNLSKVEKTEVTTAHNADLLLELEKIKESEAKMEEKLFG
jgi:hypothetical protein